MIKTPPRNFFLITFLFCTSCIWPQQLSFRNYTAEDGLTSSTVYMSIQDKKGFMWFATETGLCRFDGEYFKSYSQQQGLTDNTILKLHEDKQGLIWVITLSGKVFNFNGTRFRQLLLPQELSSAIINDIADDEFGNIWLTSNRHGLFKYKNGVFSPVVLYRNEKSLNGFTKNDPHSRWVLAKSQLICIENEKATAYKLPAGVSQSSGGSITSVNHDQVLYSKAGALILFNRSKNTHTILIRHRKNAPYIHSVFSSENNSILLSTNMGAIRIHNMKQNAFTADTFLNSKSINSVSQDREGSLWFCTMGDGVFFVPSTQILTYTTHEGLSDLKVNCLITDSTGTIWAGTENGNISYKKNSQWVTVPISGPKGIKHRINAILFSHQRLWVAQNDLLSVISLKTGNPTIEKFFYTKSAIKCLAAHPDGSVWIGTHSKLLYINKDSIHETGILGRITAISIEPSGKTWICRDGTICELNKNKIITRKKKSPLLYSRSYNMRLAADSSLWVATHGFGMVNIKHEQITNLSETEGLAGNICNAAFIEKDKPILWVATNKGLSKITLRKGEKPDIFNMTARSGIVSDELNDIIKTGDTIWLATHKGICYFDTKTAAPNKIPPPIYFLDIKIMYHDTALRTHFDLPFNQNNIEIKYIGISFRNCRSMVYEYRMTGVDSSWKKSTFNYVQYPKLPPGEYTFSVRAMNEDGLLSSQPASVHFTIHSPWWQEWWFILCTVAASLSLIFFIVYTRISSIRKKEEEKTALNKKIASLEIAALRAQMNPHFIFNCLNSIQNLMNKGDEENANLYLTKFADLLRMILENSRHETISIAKEVEALQLYADMENLRFENKFDFNVHLPEEDHIVDMKIPPLLLQPFIENSIKHGVLNKTGRGNINLSFHLSDDQLLHCIVEDNGIGRKKAKERKQDGVGSSESLGLKITQDRVLSYYQTIQADLHFVFTDLFNENGEAAGTRIEIKIPIQ